MAEQSVGKQLQRAWVRQRSVGAQTGRAARGQATSARSGAPTQHGRVNRSSFSVGRTPLSVYTVCVGCTTCLGEGRTQIMFGTHDVMRAHHMPVCAEHMLCVLAK